MSQPVLVLTVDEIVTIVRRFGALLAVAEDHLNEMNVFPLADRDTGTNLLRTVSHLIDELDAGGDGSIGQRAGLASLAAARGNSGLIVSQYLAAFLAEVGNGGSDGSPLDGAAFVSAVTRAAEQARAALSAPVEGTVISVADAVARAVGAAFDSLPTPDTGRAVRADLAGLAAIAHGASLVALAATPSQLPVLAEAGFVDAGGAGLVLLFQAVAEQLGLGVGNATAPGPAPGSGEPSRGSSGPDSERPEAVAPLDLELQFTFAGSQTVADLHRSLLAGFGRDVVVSWAQGVGRAHVHLDASRLGPAFEAIIGLSSPHTIMIEPLVEAE